MDINVKSRGCDKKGGWGTYSVKRLLRIKRGGAEGEIGRGDVNSRQSRKGSIHSDFNDTNEWRPGKLHKVCRPELQYSIDNEYINIHYTICLWALI